jgi:ABC-2 type transport system ATP-binding protein
MVDVILQNITKTYNKGETHAVNDVSFAVEKGELFGLIGPDGAGKTSIFRILTTLLLADSGTATVNGFDVVKDYRCNPQPDWLHAWQILTCIRI